MNATIDTERLTLRPWREGDTEESQAVYCDPEVRYFTGGTLRADEMASLVCRRIEAQARGELHLQPLVEKASGKVVGSCGLQPLAGGPTIEIGWMLARGAWGKGFATEISRAVLRHGLDVLKLPRIAATIDPRNARSVATVNRLGMRFDRVIRVYKHDMLCYEALP